MNMRFDAGFKLLAGGIVVIGKTEQFSGETFVAILQKKLHVSNQRLKCSFRRANLLRFVKRAFEVLTGTSAICLLKIEFPPPHMGVDDGSAVFNLFKNGQRLRKVGFSLCEISCFLMQTAERYHRHANPPCVINRLKDVQTLLKIALRHRSITELTR